MIEESIPTETLCMPREDVRRSSTCTATTPPIIKDPTLTSLRMKGCKRYCRSERYDNAITGTATFLPK